MRELTDGEKDILAEQRAEGLAELAEECPLCTPHGLGYLCPQHDAEAQECDGCGVVYLPDDRCSVEPAAWSSADGLARCYCRECSKHRG